MNEREKIIEIIAPFISAYGEDEAIADALVEAGIGDVTEYKETIRDLNTDVVAYRALSKADTLEQIIEGQKSLMDEYKHRAEVAEKEREEYRKSTRIALKGIEILKRNIIGYFVTEIPSILQQAEREIEEEERK